METQDNRLQWFKVLFLTFNLFHPMDHTLFCQFGSNTTAFKERNTVRPLKLEDRKQKSLLLLHRVYQRVYVPCRVGRIPISELFLIRLGDKNSSHVRFSSSIARICSFTNTLLNVSLHCCHYSWCSVHFLGHSQPRPVKTKSFQLLPD